MNEFLDTSVLVAAFLGDHVHHDASSKVFARVHKRHSGCSTHSLAELYATLTALPLKPKITADQAMLFIQDVKDRLTLVSLDESEYFESLKKASEQGISGGRIYDALILQCAVKANASVIYTWNLKHFHHLAPHLAARIKTPEI